MLKKTFESLLGPVLFFALWNVLSVSRIIDPDFFPPPIEIFSRLFELLALESFREHVLRSFYRLGIATLLSVPAAVLLAPALVLNETFGKLLKPLIALFYPLPKLAIFPLLLLMFGIGDGSKVAVIFIGLFFLVLLSAIQGIERLRSSGYYDLAKVYQIPFRRRLLDISIRGNFPEILNGLKMGLGQALVLIVASEFTIADKGIGVFIWSAWDQFNLMNVYAGIFLLSIVSLVIFSGLDQLQKRARR